MIVRVQLGRGFDWGEKFSDGLASGFDDGRYQNNLGSTEIIGTSENFGQVFSHMEGVDNCLILVDRAMDEMVVGLCNKVENDVGLNRKGINSLVEPMNDVVA